MSQRELATRSGLTDRSIGDLERGAVVRPRWHSVHAIAAALGLAGEELARFVAVARERPLPPIPVQAGDLGEDLIGRQAELGLVAGLVVAGRQRLLTVTGPAGVGKSRLVAEVATVVTGRANMDVRQLDLSSVTDPDLVAELIAEAIGAGGASRLDPLDRIAAQVRDTRLVVVLDRFERVLPAASAVRELVRRCGRLTMLCTSQVPLGADGERVVRLAPLPVPEPGLDATATAGAAAAVLLARLAAEVRPDFQVTEANHRAVAEICRRVDGLPLGLELAAARLRTVSPAELADRMRPQLSLLVNGRRGLPPRHRSLRAAIESNLDVVAGEGRDLCAWLGAFPAGVRLADLEAVAEALGWVRTRVLDGLDGLIEAGLVRPVEEASGTRYRLPDPVAELADELLTARPDEVTVRRAMALRYLNLVSADLTGPAAAALTTVDSANVREALVWVTTNEPALLDAARIRVVARHHLRTGRLAEGQAMLERMAETAAPASAHARIRAGYLAAVRYDIEAAERLAAAGLAQLAPDDHEGRLLAHHTLGNAARLRRDVGTAKAEFEQALAHGRASRDRREIVKALHNLALAVLADGDAPGACRLLTEAESEAREVNPNGAVRGHVLSILAEIELDLGAWAAVVDHNSLAAALLEASGNARMASVARAALALAHLRLGAQKAARAAADQAARHATAHGDEALRGVVALRISVVRHATGDAGRGVRDLAAVLSLLAATTDEAVRDALIEELAPVLEGHADLIARRDPVTAARLLGAADRCRGLRSSQVPESDRTAAMRAAALCQAALGDQAYGSEHDTGNLADWHVLAGWYAGIGGDRK